MKHIPKRYFRLLTLSTLILLIFFIISGTFIVSHQRNLLMNNERQQVHLELNLIAGFIQESFLKMDFAKVSEFLQNWVKKQQSIVKLTATAQNGFEFFSYVVPEPPEHILVVQQQVTFAQNMAINLSVERDLTPIENIIHRLNLQLLIIFSIIFVLLGIILAIALVKIALIPMEQEIERRTNELQTIHRQNQSILESVGEGIFGLDNTGTIIFANSTAVQILKIPVEQLIGKHYLEVSNHAKADKTRYLSEECPICRSVRFGTMHRTDTEFVLTADGEYLPVEYIVTPLIDLEKEQITGAVVVFHDITKRKEIEIVLMQAKRAAEQANRAKSEFLANVSHELRTPLNAIIGYSEILYEDMLEQGNENFASDLKNILSASEMLLQLISEVLDIVKIETNTVTITIREISILQLIDEITGIIMPLIRKNKNTIRVEYQTNITHFHIDVEKFRQILLNLLDNATKFTSAGEIHLIIGKATRENGEYIFFSVRDEGIGIAKEQQTLLFQPFYQIDSAATRKYGGLGLGLTLTKEFVEVLGGFITVESEEGKGSDFCVYFPINENSMKVTTECN